MVLRLTDKGILRALWLALALIYPLFAVEFFRYNILSKRIHIAIPIVIIGIIMMAGILVFMFRGRIAKRFVLQKGWVSLLMTCLVLFLFFHLIDLMRAVDDILALREVVKLALGMMSFGIVVFFFPTERKFLEKFWQIVIWSSTGLMLFLIYKYAFVFKSSILGAGLTVSAATAQNQLAWYLTLIFPLAISYFWNSKRKIIVFLPLSILIIALIYVASRAAWISTACGFIFIIFSLIKNKQIKILGTIKIFIFIILIVGVMLLWIMPTYLNLDTSVFSKRLISIYNPSVIPGEHSTEVRMRLVREAWQDFQSSPIIGIGLTNFGWVTHNDYTGLLAELGIVGLILFLGILAIVIRSTISKKSRYYNPQNMSWVLLGTRGALVAVMVSFIFINAYTLTIFWIFLGLALVAGDSERYPKIERKD